MLVRYRSAQSRWERRRVLVHWAEGRCQTVHTQREQLARFQAKKCGMCRFAGHEVQSTCRERCREVRCPPVMFLEELCREAMCPRERYLEQCPGVASRNLRSARSRAAACWEWSR